MIPTRVLLFQGLKIANDRQDICTEHMRKYPVIFCDFKFRELSFQTVHTTRLRIAKSHRHVLEGNAFELQRHGFRPLRGVARLPHAVP